MHCPQSIPPPPAKHTQTPPRTSAPRPKLPTPPKPVSKAWRSMPVTTKTEFFRSPHRSLSVERSSLLGPLLWLFFLGGGRGSGGEKGEA